MEFKHCVPLAKYDLVASRLVSNDLIFSNDIPVNIQLLIFLLISNIMELSIGAKNRKFW